MSSGSSNTGVNPYHRDPPTFTGVKKYRDEYCDMLIHHMEQGKSFNTFGATIRVSSATLHRWCEEHKEFKEAKEIGTQARMAWIEEVTLSTMSGEIKGNASLLQFMLKNGDPDSYKDKQEVEHKGNVNFILDTGIKRPGDVGYQDWIEADVVPKKLKKEGNIPQNSDSLTIEHQKGLSCL